MHKINHKIRFRILVLFTVVLCLLLGSAMFGVYWLQRRTIDLQASSRLTTLENAFTEKIDRHTELLNGLADFIRRDADLKAAWMAKDKKALLQSALPIFSYMQVQHNLDAFSFYRLDGTPFLRVQHPEDTDGMLDASIVKREEKMAEEVSGIQIAPSGAATLMVISPWWIDGELTGFIVLKTDLARFLKELSGILRRDLFFVVSKAYLQRGAWEERQTQAQGPGTWEDMSGFVVDESTRDDLVPALEGSLHGVTEQGTFKPVHFSQPTTHWTYRGGALPLMDLDGRVFGNLVLVYDVTNDEAALRLLLLTLAGIFIAVGGVLFAVFFVFIGRIEERLAKTFRALKMEIDERRQVEVALQESEEKYRDFVEGTEDLIVQLDGTARFLYVNNAAERILGLTKEECIGLNAFEFVHPDERERSRKAFEEWKTKKLSHLTWETRIVGRHKEERTMLSMVNLHFDRNGNLENANCIARDMTAHRKYLESLEQLHLELETEKRKLEQLLNIDHSIRTILDLNHLVDFIIEKTTEILEAERCSLMLLDAESGELLIRGAKGLDGQVVKRARVRIGEGIAGTVAKVGNPLLVTDTETNSLVPPKNRTRYKGKSFMSAPIHVHGKIVGVINVTDKTGAPEKGFTAIDLKILCTIVRQATIAIENATYYRKLEHLSVTDSLTGLFNHRYFLKSLDHEIERAKRYPKPFCMIMLDIDDFKAYNDTYGHLGGDQLLKEIGRTLKENLRSVDIVCRYAGDEFVIILPETDVAEAQMIGEKIKTAVKALKLNREITVSIGIAKFTPRMDRRDLIMKSDQALYQSKRAGKNMISCFY